MKKSVCFILIIYCSLIVLPIISAAVGVSPGSYSIDFSPGLEKDFYFTFLFDKDAEAEVSAIGALKDFVTLSTSKITGNGVVKVTLKLPHTIEKPGDNTVEISAQQIPKSKEGVQLIGRVIGVINVKVPYPGKYAEVSIATTDANAGDPVNVTIVITNLGTDSLIAHSVLSIVDGTNITLEEIDLGSDVIETKTTKNHFLIYPTTDYKPGDYRARATVDYGVEKPAVRERQFRLGRLYIGIMNYTKEFFHDKINRFEIDIESFWNNPIENVYARVIIENTTVEFTTPSVMLEPWEHKQLIGFFDSSTISEETFNALITLYYHEETTQKRVTLSFIKTLNYMMISITIGVIFVILALLGVIFFLLRKLKIKPKTKR